MERFWSKTTPEPNSGCWLWTASLGSTGYGQISIDGRHRKAHRVSWELHNGEIPDGMCVLHRCDVPSCVNPEHLWLGDQPANLKDMWAKGRGVAPFAGMTHCKRGHEFTHENTYTNRQGKRICRECRKDYQRQWRAENPDRAKEYWRVRQTKKRRKAV